MTQKLIISFFISILFFSCNSTYESLYQNPQLIIDGLSNDWETALDYKKSNEIYYSITNDTNNLYIRLNVNDQAIQRKIMMSGLTIWIDTTGSKKQELGIQCPVKKDFGKMDRKAMMRSGDINTLKIDPVLEMELIGFSKNIEYSFSSSKLYGIEISILQDNFKSMFYEMMIPFSALSTDFYSLHSKKLNIGIETGSIELPSQGNPSSMVERSGRGGGKAGGGGGRAGGGTKPSGGMGGKGPSGQPRNGNSMENLTNPTKIWIKNITLSQHQKDSKIN